ncbi:PREDICTED: ejaculatory bulb-specific protein 3-like [Papilio xuthus]|uniref:Chemosensory protein 8b n=1 Tax=Papilio xuthus TaxID=66420 RepID=B5U9W9_PAPXU|nr:ejaculatory bulb-specific protein 3-like precursor [Papilio xuthus]XP_013162802.1 PREDICTED: ejaculatory bulb-specific protein 3-like [Papilio xuthus]KPJ05756.1 Ejaculatory bulb-specific protein 3 [Papilio xuthus]BAG71917.1 chemosensory protein 8b [Papilio xuthus]BAM18556.1 ejaculatory bulb protein III [Papilio xuthus]
MASKSLIILLCVVASVWCTYTNKYDNINYEEVVSNEKLLNKYADCILDRGRCTAEAKELKEHLKEAIENGCKECTEKQKEGTNYVIRYLIENKRNLWEELCAKFDPDGKWRKHYEEEAKAKGIKIP